MSVPYPNVKPQFNDVNGVPLSGGKMYIYVAGSSTPATSYSDPALATPNTNPIVLDSRGEASIFFADGSYKFVLKDSLDVTVFTEDNITIEDFSATSTLLSKYTVAYSDLATAATTDTETLFSLPQKTVIEYIVIKHSTAFAGGSISALTVDVGDSGDADALVAGFNVMATVAESASEATSVVYMGAFATTKDIILTATATGDNLDQLTAGSVDIWVKTKGMN